MPSKEVFIRGKVKFAHTKRPNKYGKYSVLVYPDPESLTIINKMKEDGLKNELKRDDDGDYMAFHREPEKTDRQQRRYSLGAPVVIDQDGRMLDGYVGNGSDCGIKLETYWGTNPIGAKYFAARFAGLKVYNLIPYNPSDSDVPQEVKGAKNFDIQPAPQGW